MKILIKQDFDTMSEWAKMLLLSTMSQDKRVNLSITAGKTPALVYQKLASIVKTHLTLIMFIIITLMKSRSSSKGRHYSDRFADAVFDTCRNIRAKHPSINC